MKTHRIKSWLEFVEAVHQLNDEAVSWIFRGIRAETHGLRPKVGRDTIPFSDSPLVDLHSERNALDDFKRFAHPLVEKVPASDIEWLTLAQHHELPTRLLDWTESPYVAAFFAVRFGGLPKPTDPKNFLDGAVIAAPAPLEVESDVIHDPFSMKLFQGPRLYRPPYFNPRVAAQRAVLTIHPIPYEDWDPEGATKIILPGYLFRNFRSALSLTGFNEASMFPDLDGLGRHLGLVHTFRI